MTDSLNFKIQITEKYIIVTPTFTSIYSFWIIGWGNKKLWEIFCADVIDFL